MELEKLEEIGLTKSEIRVYETLLELGLSTIGNISKKAKVSTSKIYEVLDRLIKKGLVSYSIKSETKYFSAASPSMLKEYIKMKLQKVKQEEKIVNKLIPKLNLKRKLTEKSEAVIYEGVKGMKAIANEILESKEKEFFVFSSTPYKDELFNRFWINWNINQRTDNKIKMKIIFGSERTDFSKEYEKMRFTEVKYIKMPTHAGFGVIDNKLIIFTYTSTPYFFLIVNEDAAKSFRSFFNIIWNKFYHGF